ncbi:hypothetical protein DL98DRAFT_538388 [Cadophora sp. DSE1049]|nr:hypothetical protein DL98DRAFT_538388 [Cadophora sp. DSE1049]
MPWSIDSSPRRVERFSMARQHYQQLELPSTCTPEKMDENKEYLRRKLHPKIAIHCQGTLVQNCALEIFSAFFMEATAGAERLLGNTVFRRGIDLPPREESRDFGRDMWVNDVIDKIARVLFDCGFVDSQGEGRNIIVPVLSDKGLLPTHETSRERQQGPMDKWLVQM